MEIPLPHSRENETPFRPRHQRAPLAVSLPATLFALLMLAPLLYLIIRSSELGIGALEFMARPATLTVLVQSIALAITTTLITILLGVPLAWLTTRTDLPGRRIWLMLSVIPLAIPSYVGGFVLVSALGPRGMVQQMLEPLGVTRLPEIYGFPGACLALSLFSYPYMLLSVRAALRGLDPALEESARSLGRTPWDTFWQLTLPLLRPAITSGSILVSLYALSDFGAVALLQFNSFTRAIYVQYTASLNRSGAAVLALMLVLLTLTVLFIENRTQGQMKYYSTGGAKRKHKTISLGKWKIPALLFCAVVVLVALGMPLGVLVFWLLRGLGQGDTIRALDVATFNSIYAGLLAAIATVLIALPIAFWYVRYAGRPSRYVRRIAYIGYALPGVVVALALVFFAARYLPVVYQTMGLLIFAYVVRFLPEALGAIEAALRQVNPRVEEAGRSLGYGPVQVLWRLTFPMARGGIASAAALVFLTTMKELPATLILGPIGFETLATRIWSASSEAFFARAAAPSLLLLAFSALSIVPILVANREQD